MADGKIRNLLPLRLILFILMILVIAHLGLGFARQAMASQKRREALRHLEKEVVVAQKEAAWLEERLGYMQSREAAEEWARENGWVRDGEVSVVVVAPAAAQALIPGQEAPDATYVGSNRMAWWNLFFGDQ
jgi:hypothetical protein